METKFKPFDKVLVRDYIGNIWNAREFDRYNRTGNGYPYICQDGVGWVQCIPFEGNEHLHDTTDDYAEPFEPKDGDFISFGVGAGGVRPVQIFKSKEDDGTHNAYVTLAVNISSYTRFLRFEEAGWFNKDMVLATEEDKQALLDALHKEGKDWDAEKKEIVDYKWKPKEGENYFTPVVYQTEFEVRESVWNGNDIEEDFFFKGLVFQTKEECQTFCNKLNVAINKVK